MRLPSITFLLLLCVAAASSAQQVDSMPPLEIPDVTVTVHRVVVLPSLRKGEVTDTTLYQLPERDSMLFGRRISGLAGSGGILPAYRELRSRVAVAAEASLGSYLSPRAGFRGEYVDSSFDVAGMIDYRGTQGHVPAAAASSLQIGVQGSGVLVGNALMPRMRASASVDRLGGSYTLYGDSALPYDRTRRMWNGSFSLESEEFDAIRYAFHLRLAATEVADALDSLGGSAQATTPELGFSLRSPISHAADADYDISLDLRYLTTSIDYGTPARTPSTFSGTASLSAEQSRVVITLGAVYGTGSFSDSGSSSLLLPRVSLRYHLQPMVDLYAAYLPEFNAPSYAAAILRTPWLQREITLRPESVPVDLRIGAHYQESLFDADANLYYRSTDNSPIVVADTLPGVLHIAYFDSRVVGAEGTLQVNATGRLALTAALRVESATDRSSGAALAMHPALQLVARGAYRISDALRSWATLRYTTAQQTRAPSSTLPERTIGSSLLLGIGGSYAITPAFELTAEVSNLLDTRYQLWDNYSAPGLEVRGGVRLTMKP